jgi:hypothetical protein
MQPDSMTVQPDYICTASRDVARRGAAEALEELGKGEPALASFIHESLAAGSGKLALSGAPTELVQSAYQEALAVVLTSVQALRRGHYEIWKDAMTGTRLAQLDDTFRAPPKRRGRRNKDTGAGPEVKE